MFTSAWWWAVLAAGVLAAAVAVYAHALARFWDRLRVEWHARQVVLLLGPDRECRTCAGAGGRVVAGVEGPEAVPCGCWDPAGGLRLRVWPRRREEVPF